MRALAVAVLGVALAGCTSAVPVTLGEARTPRSSTFATPVGNADDVIAAQDAALAAARAVMGASSGGESAEPEAGVDVGPLALEYTPETLHLARIAIAREALVDVNVAKLEIDAEEERQREVERLMEADRTSKTRLHHGAAHR